MSTPEKKLQDYTKQQIQTLNRRQLQALAKSNGIKANSKTFILVHELEYLRQKIPAEQLLVSGYYKMYVDDIPLALLQWIITYYDKYYHNKFGSWQTVMKAPNGKRYPLTFNNKYKDTLKIKGIEFTAFIYPNGCNKSKENIGQICYGFVTKCFPNNIESINIYLEMKIETTHFAEKRFLTNCKPNATNSDYWAFEIPLCLSSELKDCKTVCFDFAIHIQSIKYKKEYNQSPYYLPIKINKFSIFNWNINESLMGKWKKTMKKTIYSDTFESNNWCLKLRKPNVTCHFLRLSISNLFCPFNLMQLKFRIIYNGNTKSISDKLMEIGIGKYDTKYISIMSFAEFQKLKSIQLVVQLEINKLRDINRKIIDEREWEKHGININESHDYCISCSDEGSMSDEQRELVEHELRLCYKYGKMEVVEIRDQLGDSGMCAIVVEGASAFAYRRGLESMKWSEWECKHGSYSIIMVQYRPINSNEIVCINNGNMSTDQRNIIRNTLQYCHETNEMTPSELRDKLRDKLIEKVSHVIVIKDKLGSSAWYGNLCWSSWKDSKYGKYDIMFLSK
eukprot:172161_1